MSILVVGNAVVDIAYLVPRLPRPGETLLASVRRMDVGGKGLNQAVAARRAGSQVRLVAPVGGDQAAQRIRDLLAREGLDPALLVAVDAPTDEAVIWVAADGENAIVSTAAAAQRLHPADLAAVDSLGSTDTLLMQGNLPLEAMACCLEAARASRARIVANTAPWVPGAALLVAAADVLVVNAGEATGFSGASAPETAAEALARRGPASVVVTRGAAGAHVLSGGRHFRLPAPTVAAVDTTGAGDVLVGVLAAALDAGLELPVAADWAIRAASLKVTRQGTVAGFPSAAEVAALRAP
jgi:ribokinase